MEAKLSMHCCFTARASHFFKADLKVVVPTPMPSIEPVIAADFRAHIDRYLHSVF
jgi:hypothetical protein